ncbi:MAG: M42 family peptidase [Solirubrobacteraceae bacterium]
MAPSMIPDVFRDLLTAAGPSGYVGPAATVFREACEPLAGSVVTDAHGSTVARLAGGGGPRVAVMGHVDEIGLIVTHIDDNGFLWFGQIGGWDPQILVGQRVDVLTRAGTIPGVAGRKPIHLLTDEERKQVPKLKDLHIDIGARDGDEARSLARVGDVAVISAEPVELPNHRIVSRSLDNRVGCFVAYETLRLLSEGEAPPGEFMAVAVNHEETNFGGSTQTTYALEPDVVVVIDVTHETGAPGVDEKENGRHPYGSGPAIIRGATLSPRVFDLLVEAAEAEDIPYTIEATGRSTGTDADAVVTSRAGVHAASIGVPCRYMHSAVEMVQLDDVLATARLCAAFARRLTQPL